MATDGAQSSQFVAKALQNEAKMEARAPPQASRKRLRHEMGAHAFRPIIYYV